jgi:hypothetical protein
MCVDGNYFMKRLGQLFLLDSYVFHFYMYGWQLLLWQVVNCVAAFYFWYSPELLSLKLPICLCTLSLTIDNCVSADGISST